MSADSYDQLIDRPPFVSRDSLLTFIEKINEDNLNCLSLREALLHHPLMTEYLDFIVSQMEIDPKLRALPPQYVMGERMASLVLALVNFPSMETARAAVMSLLSVPFFINNETHQVALNLKIPPFIPDPLILPFPSIWIAFEQDAFHLSDNRSVVNLVVYEISTGIILGALLDTGERVKFPAILFGEEWTPDSRSPPSSDTRFAAPRSASDGTWTDVAQYVLALLSIINSPHIDTPQHTLPRPMRRRIGKALKRESKPSKILETQIHEVVIRRSSQADRTEPSGEKIERDFRWMVRGHVRNQWYPSKKYHKQIFVPAFVKGPADKPLRPSLYRKAKES